MPVTQRRRRSRRIKSTRWIVLAIILCSGMSCLAPVLYASTDCSRWLAEYKQGVLQRRATRRLRAAKYRLDAMLHKPAPAHHYPTRHRLSPLESLHRFQIDCGYLDQPAPPVKEAILPPLPLVPSFAPVHFGDAPPDLPPLAPADVPVLMADVPSLVDVPSLPVTNLAAPTVTPEPSSLVFMLTGAAFGAELMRRRSRTTDVADGSLPA